jgi:hypothetical protein
MSQNTTLDSTNSLSIAGVVIRQDEQGRYLLNDLHRASGSEKRHSPNYWVGLQQTQELVAMLESEHRENTDTVITVSEQNQPLRVVKGGNGTQGTFAVRELVYAYATWISAKFFLTVIRAYDALVNNKPPYGLHEIPHQAYCPTYLTPEMCDHVQVRVNEIAKIEGIHWNTKYRELKDVFHANSYTLIPITRYADVCVFLDCLPLYPIPEYIMIEGNELRELRNTRRELESLKADPTPLLICSENEIWTKCTNDSVILPYVEFEKLTAARDESPKERIAKVLKQAFDEVDAGSENILVGRQRWNELNFIVKKVMNNPEALAIL